MGRFLQRGKGHGRYSQWLLPAGSFTLMVALVGYGIHSVDNTTKEKQLGFAKEAIQRSVVQCYAIEGHYPPDIAYLQQNYGLAVDTDQYVIHYQRTAANLLPDIAVFSKEG